jgi:hypothetical protein
MSPIGPWPPQDAIPPEVLAQVLQQINLQNPDYGRAPKGNLLSAPGNVATSGNYPTGPAVGAASQEGGTGPTVTAAPQATGTAAATPSASAQASGAPSLAQTVAAGQASGVPSAPLASLWNTFYGQGGTGGGGAPTLNAQTKNSVWNVMQNYGEGGGGAGGAGGRGGIEVGRGSPETGAQYS